MENEATGKGLIKRVDCTSRPRLRLKVDGRDVSALAGDTLLVALLTTGSRVRESEFGDGARAGFCMMGVCQDCWVTMESGERVRACTTPAVDGMSITTGVAWLVRP